MKGLFGGLFDLNGDGDMSFMESALELALFSDLMEDDEAGDWGLDELDDPDAWDD
ncbi:MAG: hypothetical protein LUE21_12020 [Oscillospiraceae bacterium]|nr:hypothetical protein [Oscillospiraceae bacterium]